MQSTKALARLTEKETLPLQWATPEQRVKAALAVVRIRERNNPQYTNTGNQMSKGKSDPVTLEELMVSNLA